MQIKGVKEVKKTLASSEVVFYYYLRNDPGAYFFKSKIKISALKQLPEDFIRAFNDTKKGVDAAGSFGGLCGKFKARPAFLKLAPITRRDSNRALDILSEMPLKNGRKARGAPLHVFDNRDVIKYIVSFRDSMATTPRQADMVIGVLSQVLKYGQSIGTLDHNRAAHIDKIYDRPIDEGEGWSDKDYERFIGGDCPAELSLAAQFIRHFGTRRKDAVTMSQSADKGNSLVWQTSKGRRQRRKAIAPILPNGRAVLTALDQLRRQNEVACTTFLFSTRGRPWTPDGFSSVFDRRRKKLGIKTSMHQLRNGYSTDLLLAHIEAPETITRAVICRALGWGEAQYEEMIRIYVDDRLVIDALVNKMKPQSGNQAETETDVLSKDGA